LLFEQLRELELEGFESSFPTDLSVGMAQRVALVRALAVGRTSILLDEPYSALDELNRRTLAVRLSSEVARKGLSAVVVTHSIHDAVYLANRVLVLSERPARIRAVVAVPLSHPRGASLWDGDGLGAYVARAREVLEQPS
jgi:NitT/TauT family transport system ATP-binding protein